MSVNLQGVPGRGATVIACREPASGRSLGEVAALGAEAVRAQVARARAAQTVLAGTSLAARRRLLQRLLAHLVDHADELCELICRVSGKTRDNAMVGEVFPVAEKLRWTIAHGERHLRPERVSSGLLVHKRATIEYQPRGVIAGIVPWNYPLQNVMNPVVPALMAGNAVVVKPSEWVAAASAPLQAMFDAVLAAEGLPTDLVRIVDGYGDTGAALIAAGVDAVVFIGSVDNGRKVALAAAEQLVPAILELGGKDAMVVCDDAHLEQAVHAALAGCFINCGQNCVASERILVEDGIYDRFEARVVEMTRALRQGDSLAAAARGEVVDAGAMVTPLQLKVVDRLVRGAIEQGARVLCGGAPLSTAAGDFYPPTILADVHPGMEIMREETFGPVMLLCRVKDDDAAVALANATRFGLSSTVLSRDHARAGRILRRLEAGMGAAN